MELITSKINVKIFSYNKIISNHLENGWKMKKIPNILLSKVDSISKDLINEFENINIYDLEDLINSEKQLANKYHEYQPLIEKIKHLVSQTSMKINNIPVVSFSLPDNYACICFRKSKNNFWLGLTWQGLLLEWSRVPLSQIEEFMDQLNRLLDHFGNPELITDVRTWNFKLIRSIDPSDISVYISNFDVLAALDEYCERLNQPGYEPDIETNPILKQLFQIEYVLWIARQNIM